MSIIMTFCNILNWAKAGAELGLERGRKRKRATCGIGCLECPERSDIKLNMMPEGHELGIRS